MVDENPSIDQLFKDIRKMLVERVNARSSADLGYALTCFELNRQGTIKIKDVNLDPLPTTSTYEVKIDQSPPRSGVTQDEFAKIIHEFFIRSL